MATSSFRNRLFDGQSLDADARVECGVFDARLTRPFAQGFTGISNVVALVVLLLTLGSPTTVSGRVVSVRVDPVKTMPLGSATHVYQEGFVHVPSHANADTAPAVVAPVRRVVVIATGSHGQPCFVFDGDTCNRVTFAVSSTCSVAIATEASTGFSIPAGEIASIYDNHIVAVALTNPSDMFSDVGGAFQRYEAHESLVLVDHGVKE